MIVLRNQGRVSNDLLLPENVCLQLDLHWLLAVLHKLNAAGLFYCCQGVLLITNTFLDYMRALMRLR